ncbi:hypothetical protein SBRCBS47491_008212 [Sporothrix bragantina]|uniref:Uncharacterized protein n=1 Tax=Sporothrix bragantina TaxID=671064 RepID=A0ABP0CK60_9PEZI
MASYPTAEDEKRLVAHAATTTVLAADDNKSKCKHACRRRMAGIKKAAHFTVTLAFVVACCVAFFGLSSLAIGTVRHARAKSCTKNHSGAQGAAAVPVVVVAADAAEPTQAGGFTRLLEAVSPESLHDLLHEYFPDTYKHGVYPSEKKAMEAIHRANAALATSIVQLARRDLNGTITSGSSSAPATTSTPASSSVFKNSSSSATTTSHSSKTTSSSSETSSGKKTTSIYTSTINGTPTVVTATTVVGVGASGTGGASATNSGTLQTGAAVPLLGSQNKVLAVAGAVVGAMLI